MANKRLEMETDSDAFVLAISCHQKSIKMAWEINQVLKCELVAKEKPDEPIYFLENMNGQAYFTWHDPSERFSVHLVSNQGENQLLVPHLKEIDYFLIITGLYKELDFESGTKKIRSIDSVLTAFPITLATLKK
jgi:hypothetical protein